MTDKEILDRYWPDRTEDDIDFLKKWLDRYHHHHQKKSVVLSAQSTECEADMPFADWEHNGSEWILFFDWCNDGVSGCTACDEHKPTGPPDWEGEIRSVPCCGPEEEEPEPGPEEPGTSDCSITRCGSTLPTCEASGEEIGTHVSQYIAFDHLDGSAPRCPIISGAPGTGIIWVGVLTVSA